MLSSDEFAILDLAVEDSFGFWEIASVIQQQQPDLSTAGAIDLAKNTVHRLLEMGFVSVCYQDDVGVEELPVSGDDASAAIADGSNWEWPVGYQRMYRVLATDEGRHAYYSSGR
jgi:hypothetical protein